MFTSQCKFQRGDRVFFYEGKTLVSATVINYTQGSGWGSKGVYIIERDDKKTHLTRRTSGQLTHLDEKKDVESKVVAKKEPSAAANYVIMSGGGKFYSHENAMARATELLRAEPDETFLVAQVTEKVQREFSIITEPV